MRRSLLCLALFTAGCPATDDTDGTDGDVNAIPAADDIALTTNEDVPIAANLIATDSDGDELTYTVTTEPQHGELSGTAPSLVYTPNDDFDGSDSFTFIANDGTDDSAVATVSITMTPVNDAPSADDAAVTVDEDGSVIITMTGTDVDLDALTYTAGVADHGTIEAGAGDTVTYTPDPNYNGADQFLFTANDGTLDSTFGTIDITVTSVHDIPVAVDTTVYLNEDAEVPADLTGTDADGGPLSYELLTEPTNGRATGTARNLMYAPDANYNGTDSLTFRVTDGDGNESNIGTVTFLIAPVNDEPRVQNLQVETVEETPIEIEPVGQDVEDDDLSFAPRSNPSHGTLTTAGDNLLYTPDPDFSGMDQFTYGANDGASRSDDGIIRITVTPVNDAPTAESKTVAVLEDTPTMIDITGEDPDGDSLFYTITSDPTLGTLVGAAPTPTYQPAENASGADQFTYTVSDGSETVEATITIDLQAVNDEPVADGQQISVEEGVATPITLTYSDVEGDDVTWTVTALPSSGSLTGTAPDLTYTSDVGATTDLFRFRVNDGTDNSAQAQIDITITAATSGLVANIDMYEVEANLSLTMPAPGVLANDTSDGSLDAVPETVPTESGGSATIGNNGSFVYHPGPNLVPGGIDRFQYQITDGDGETATATVRLDIGDTPVWFVDNSASGANYWGTQLRPFGTLDEAVAQAGDDDIIYVRHGDGTNTGLSPTSLVLPIGVDLIAEGVGLTMNGVELEAAGTAPALSTYVDGRNGGDVTLAGFDLDGRVSYLGTGVFNLQAVNVSLTDDAIALDVSGGEVILNAVHIDTNTTTTLAVVLATISSLTGDLVTIEGGLRGAEIQGTGSGSTVSLSNSTILDPAEAGLQITNTDAVVLDNVQVTANGNLYPAVNLAADVTGDISLTDLSISGFHTGLSSLQGNSTISITDGNIAADDTALSIQNAGNTTYLVQGGRIAGGLKGVAMTPSAAETSLMITNTTIDGGDSATSDTEAIAIEAGTGLVVSLTDVTIDVPSVAVRTDPNVSYLVLYIDGLMFTPTNPDDSALFAAVDVVTGLDNTQYVTMLNSTIDCAQLSECVWLENQDGAVGVNLVDNEIGMGVTLEGNIILASTTYAGGQAAGSDNGEIAAAGNTDIGGGAITVNTGNAMVRFRHPSTIEVP